MSSIESPSLTANECKEKGNVHFINKEFQQAIDCYSQAIDLDSNIDIYHSNRCNAYLQLKKYKEALSDAYQCIHISPNWHKGYFLKSRALFGLEKVLSNDFILEDEYIFFLFL
jgi:tetratricopeptide (TPR) repeat protein